MDLTQINFHQHPKWQLFKSSPQRLIYNSPYIIDTLASIEIEVEGDAVYGLIKSASNPIGNRVVLGKGMPLELFLMLIAMLGEAQRNYETLVLMQQSTKPNFTIIKEPFSPITPSKKSKILFALAPFFLLIVGSIFLLRIRIFLAKLLTRVKI